MEMLFPTLAVLAILAPYMEVGPFLAVFTLPSFPRCLFCCFLTVLTSPFFPHCHFLPFLAIFTSLSFPRQPYLAVFYLVSFPFFSCRSFLTVLSFLAIFSFLAVLPLLSFPFLHFLSSHTAIIYEFIKFIYHYFIEKTNNRPY